MRKTYTKKCDFEIVIKGNWSVGYLWENELKLSHKEDIFEYVMNHLEEYSENIEVRILNTKIIEENWKKFKIKLDFSKILWYNNYRK